MKRSGWLAHIPGLTVLVPSNPADAGGFMAAALVAEGPVIYLEHKLLSAPWLDALGIGGRFVREGTDIGLIGFSMDV